MEKLDRLGWAAGMSIVSYGVRLGLRATQSEGIDAMIPHLPPGWKQAPTPVVDDIYSLVVGGAGTRPGSRRFHLLYGGPARLARSMELEEALTVFESYLHLSVAALAARRTFVHAGVVGWGGKAIVIPGRSHTGKSALVAALVRAGATYYSDEYAVLDSGGRVHPFRRPLTVRSEDGAEQRRWVPDDPRSASAARPLPMGLVAVTAYRPGGRWRPRERSLGSGVLALLAYNVSARRRPGPPCRASGGPWPRRPSSPARGERPRRPRRRS
jgi:hypothetical protein